MYKKNRKKYERYQTGARYQSSFCISWDQFNYCVCWMMDILCSLYNYCFIWTWKWQCIFLSRNMSRNIIPQTLNMQNFYLLLLFRVNMPPHLRVSFYVKYDPVQKKFHFSIQKEWLGIDRFCQLENICPIC